MSDPEHQLLLLDSVLVEPAQALGEVPAQGDGEDVEEGEQSEGVEQHHRALQEGQSWAPREKEKDFSQIHFSNINNTFWSNMLNNSDLKMISKQDVPLYPKKVM